MRLLFAIVIVLVSGCSTTQTQTIPQEPKPELLESITVQEAPLMQFAPLNTLVEWHSDSCNPNAAEFSDNYIGQRKIQMFFKSLCSSKSSEARLIQLANLVNLYDWPHNYLFYFALIEQREKQVLELNTQLAQIQKQTTKLKTTLNERNLELRKLKSQLAEIQKQKLDAAITPLTIQRD